MRLFIAIPLPKELTKPVTETMHALKQAGVLGNYTPLQNMHLTLAFIGEVRDPASIKEALRKVSCKAVRLSLGELGNFEDTVWLGIKGNQALSALSKAVRDALEDSGIPYDHNKFVPHITLVRKARGKWMQIRVPRAETIARTVSLMKSEEKDGKRIYTEIFTIRGE